MVGSLGGSYRQVFGLRRHPRRFSMDWVHDFVHWAMAIKLCAPHISAHRAVVTTESFLWRIPRLNRGSGIPDKYSFSDSACLRETCPHGNGELHGFYLLKKRVFDKGFTEHSFPIGMKKPNKDHLWVAMMVVAGGAFGKSTGVSQE